VSLVRVDIDIYHFNNSSSSCSSFSIWDISRFS